MTTLFGGEARDLCGEMSPEKKAKINQPTPQNGDVDHLKGLSESHPLPEFFCVIVDKRVCADTV